MELMDKCPKTEGTQMDARLLHVDVSMSDKRPTKIEVRQERSVVPSQHEETKRSFSLSPFQEWFKSVRT